MNRRMFFSLGCFSTFCTLGAFSAYGMEEDESSSKIVSVSVQDRKMFVDDTKKDTKQGNNKPKPHSSANKVKIPESLKSAFSAGENRLSSFIDVPVNPSKEEVIESNNNNTNYTKVEPSIKAKPEDKNPKGSQTSFEQKLQDTTLQVKTLEMMGLPNNQDNIAARFLSEEDLYERIINNFHGHELNLQDMAFPINSKSILLLDSLKHTKSVRKLVLTNAHLTTQAYLSLASSLAYNRSLQALDLSQASWQPKALELLGLALKDHKTLKNIVLQPKNTVFTASQVEEFYELIKDNKGLRLINWPEDKSVLSKIEKLTGKNAVAALHYGVMHTEGVKNLVDQDFKKAENYLKKALELGHPAAEYELGGLKEQSQPEEAFKLYLASANKGFAPAQLKVSEYYRAVWPKGTMTAPDYKNAHLWCNLAAKQDYPEALYRLGRFYEAGRFVEKSFDNAAHYFYQAAEWGHPEAFTALGTIYLNPDYSGSKLETAKDTAHYYLEWGKRFTETKGTAEKHLTYLEQDRAKK